MCIRKVVILIAFERSVCLSISCYYMRFFYVCVSLSLFVLVYVYFCVSLFIYSVARGYAFTIIGFPIAAKQRRTSW